MSYLLPDLVSKEDNPFTTIYWLVKINLLPTQWNGCGQLFCGICFDKSLGVPVPIVESVLTYEV